ncbi:MAG TPA: alpha/beta family hydrolase [Frankiaceae bacterium]|nr:alpha/beta family hydrolase [Frankiaceae bacterium]
MRNTGTFTLATPRGDARVSVDSPPGQTNGVAILFHGAGGTMNAPVLVAARDALLGIGWRVVRLDQPYVVAGRRAPAPAAHLDEVALLTVEEVRGEGEPLLLAGKSSGARVTCRTARAAGALGCVAYGFPLHPPGRPEKTRAPELNAAGVPVLVCQGVRDAFGTPDDVKAAAKRGVKVSEVPGDHSMRTKAAIEAAVALTVRWVQART